MYKLTSPNVATREKPMKNQGSINQIVDEMLANFPPKQRKILSDRFGLKNGKSSALQKIGSEFNITRERVRQIIEQSLKELKDTVSHKVGDLLGFAKEHLGKSGGVRRDDAFITDLKFFAGIEKDEKYSDEKIRFLLWASKALGYEKEDEDMRSFWYIGEDAKGALKRFIDEMISFFENTDRKAILNDKVYLEKLEKFPECHYISISKRFGTNVFGDLGLVEWPEIQPKTIRDKIYLALRKHDVPLHFEAIAEYITDTGIERKSVHVQTVHNELIKDDRFVLVGRGIYALKEKGFEAGTVRELIVKLLKSKGPLHPHEVVSLVNERRFFKENTILLNLQNKKFFNRKDDGRYHVKEA